MSKKLAAVCGILLVLVGVFGGFLLFNKENTPVNAGQGNPDDYPLLARRLFMDDPNDPIINFAPLRVSLNEYFEQNNLEGSLYFEYLPTGTSVRIAGEEKEVAASLIKLPAAMEIFKAQELGRIDLSQEIELKEEWLDDGFGELYKKGAGYKLTLREAVEIMLRDSDNTALKAVSNSMMGLVSSDENPFNFLDTDFTQNYDLTVSIAAKSYSSFLKCLYFSCYLTKEDSQKILDYLSDTKFDERMVAGVSGGVTVAHKVGNHEQETQSDCGIVYLELRNYLQCAMIEGPDTPETDKHIAELSRLSYEYLINK